MSTVAPRLDGAPPALCPTCGRPSTPSATVRRSGDILTAHYLCDGEHLWIEHWTDLSGRE